MAQVHNLRLAREITEIQRSCDLSLSVAFRESNVRRVRALITGPPETPYGFGFFEFYVKFGKDYPTKPPEATAITTNSGQTRFNPNIYAGGKVCLSILGTWRGEKGEEWSSAQGLESILISIQSLMSADPYVNEPGYESSSNSPEGRDYCAKIHHETIRISILKRLEDYLGIEPPSDTQSSPSDALNPTPFGQDQHDDVYDPFRDLCKRRFLWYYTSYQQSIDENRQKHGNKVKDGKNFAMMRFESDGNQMSGKFNYTSLKRRLEVVRDALNQETERWASEGRKAVERENPIALTMLNTFKSMPQKFHDSGTTLDFELIDNNPFDWRIILFGSPTTNLDGGIFKIRMVFSINFPEEQPRARVETPLFHHRVSPDGVLCYVSNKPEEIKSHVGGIIEAIQSDSARCEAWTCVNPEASKLLWGNEDQKKVYNRKVRRSAQESCEY